MASIENSGELSAAQKLMQKHAEHAPHAVTVEDVPDVDLPKPTANDASGSWAAPMSSTAAGKQKEKQSSLDTQSHELFPELGAPKSKAANVAPIWSAKNGAPAQNGSNGAPQNVPAPRSSDQARPAVMSIPGRKVESVTLEPQFIMQRDKLKRPIPEILRDLNRKSRANITMTSVNNGHIRFDAAGPQDVAQQALKDLVAQIGRKTVIEVPIPYSARENWCQDPASQGRRHPKPR
ncbi:hypothetical protein NLG97_g7754 [Lecanicillium saksenae]|uniref:Uncharacterized protein n=1 Tax=Lecanicillium saksenae TaxID=468837 RepID=A0ACC1QMR3_9HYPO|nr:hypothetical protein NLG97_g7754 [Lecanicillium saksenae]